MKIVKDNMGSVQGLILKIREVLGSKQYRQKTLCKHQNSLTNCRLVSVACSVHSSAPNWHWWSHFGTDNGTVNATKK